MPSLRTTRILNDIYAVFDESDFDLRTNKKLLEKNLDKLQICININGTATVAAPCKHGGVLYMTFEGNGRVDLWDGRRGSSFYIEENDYSSEQIFITQSKYSPEEIRRRFHKEMTDEWGLEFKNGEHQLFSPNWPGMLAAARIVPQVFKVFCEDDFSLTRPNELSFITKNRFECLGVWDGTLTISAWTQGIWEGQEEEIRITFDGSDAVTIDKYPYNDSQQIPISEARNVLVNTYGVSFEKAWREPMRYTKGIGKQDEIFQGIDDRI